MDRADQHCRRLRSTSGFTLTELLVGIVVLIALSAIALPQFAGMKTNAYNSHALSSLESLAKAQASRRATDGAYVPCGSTSACMSTFPGLRVGIGVDLSAEVEGDGFVASASHDKGDTTYFWDSHEGGLQDESGGDGDPPPDDPDDPTEPGKPGKPDKPGKPGKPR